MKIYFVLIGLFFTSLANAQNLKTDLHFGLSSATNEYQDFSTERGTSHNFGIGLGYTTQSNIIIGVSFDYEYIDISPSIEPNTDAIGLDVKLGYQMSDFSAYGLIGVKASSFEDSGFYGFGYGVGMQWDISKDYGFNLQYKKYSLHNTDLLDYDYSTIGLNFLLLY